MSSATRDLRLIRDAFASVRKQFHDEEWVIDSIITTLDLARGVVDATLGAQGSDPSLDATDADPDAIVEALNGRDENVGE